MASVAGASAQQPTATTGVAQPRVEASSRVDVTKLPIDMARIRRQLVRVTVREERDGLNLRYQVDVFAKAPPIDLFPSSRLDPNFWTGPAPYGAPTHRQFLNLWTPQEHRGQAADFGALVRWLADKSTGEKNTKK
jgi:hypothetical protein